MNKNYGKLAAGQIEYAPSSIATDSGVVMNPSEATYLAAGWKKVVDAKPETESGYTAVITRWSESEDTLTAVYKVIEDSSSGGAGHRVFSKLKVVEALKKADKWVLVKTWLEERAYYDYYLAAQDFAEDNPLFIEGKAAIQRYIGVSDEEIEAILSQCVIDQ